MPPDWSKIVADSYVAASVVSALVILGDILSGRRQPMALMNVVWPITALYFGPLGLWAYWVMGRPKAGMGYPRGDGRHGHDEGHEGPRQPSLQTVFGAASHCGAGCTLGDTIGEAAISLAGFTLLGARLLAAYVVDFSLAI